MATLTDWKILKMVNTMELARNFLLKENLLGSGCIEMVIWQALQKYTMKMKTYKWNRILSMGNEKV